MQIQIVIDEWEQACCGRPFSVGDQMTWKIVAADPASTPTGSPTRFSEEHHGQTPPDVPHWDVTGRVTAISGVRYPEVAVPGQARTFTWDTAHPERRALQIVNTAEGIEANQYVVDVEVSDDVALPSYMPSAESGAREEADARTAVRNHTRMSDPVGVILETLARDAEHRFAGTAQITRTAGRSAMSIEPHRGGTTAIHWARSDADADGISAHVGDGDWHFAATIDEAIVLGLFLEAAACGSVEERVVLRDGSPASLDTVVSDADGREWTATDVIDSFGPGTGVRVMAGYFWKRIERGNHRYLPWVSPADPPPLG